MAVHYLGDNGPDGVVMGTSATEKIGFFGATPVVKQTSSALANIGTTADILSSTLIASTTGLTTAGQEAVINAVNAIAEALYSYGLISDS